MDRIDVHAHSLPNFYRDALLAAGKSKPDGMPAIPEWSEDLALRTMDQLRIRKAILSISSPGVYFGDLPAAGKLARRVNDEAAHLAARNPSRFGWFATTPLPDVHGAVMEVEHALDVLKADGIVLESNYDGMYLGDARLNSLYESLNERRAVVFIHPTSPSCPGCGALALGYPEPMLEFMFETTRSVAQLILSGVTVRYPEIRIVVPHAGAALPILASRIDLLMPFFHKNVPQKAPSIRQELRKLYHDLAGAPLPELLSSLSIADQQKLLCGSDWPFTQTAACAELASQLDTCQQLTPDLHNMVMSLNAEQLFRSDRRPQAELC